MNKTYRNHIHADPEIMFGKPVIKGTRVPVELILRKLGEGETIEDLLQAYPHLTREDILATFSYSADVIGTEEMVELGDK